MEDLLVLGPYGLLGTGLNLLGAGLKQANFFPNRFIPLALMCVGAALCPFVAQVRPESAPPPLVWQQVLIGWALGAMAVGHHQVFSQLQKGGKPAVPEADWEEKG